MYHNAVEVKGASKVFGSSNTGVISKVKRKIIGAQKEKKQTRAVDNVNFDIRKGEIFGVLGLNGSGKSTLIRLITTLLIPDSGTIKVFGKCVEKDSDEVKRLINRISVDAAFFKKLSALENLLYAARLYRVSPEEAKAKAFEILGRLGIEKTKITEPLEEMSRGMQQKVAIARAFLNSPIVLLLDEPTTGLDPRSKRDVQEFVLEVRENHNASVLLTTHDMAEAERLCDRIAIIDHGKIVALGTANELKRMARTNGAEPSLEDVFIKLTGKEFLEKEDILEKNKEVINGT